MIKTYRNFKEFFNRIYVAPKGYIHKFNGNCKYGLNEVTVNILNLKLVKKKDRMSDSMFETVVTKQEPSLLF